MAFSNTSGYQDVVIDKAESAKDLVGELLEIIEDLDDQLTAWKDAGEAADIDTPEALESYLARKAT